MSKVFDFNNHVKNLPDCYAKGEQSNNYKILENERIAVNGLYTDIQDIWNSLDIDKATGATLDLYGEMLSQPRGQASDEQYKLMLKSKLLQNVAGGDYASVLNAICLTFNCEPSEVYIKENFTDTTSSVAIEKLPLGVIAKSGMNTAQTIQIIKRLLPVGIEVEAFSFEGTFEFSATEDDMSVDGATKGFTDTEENMTVETAIGGYLGGIYDGNDQELPI